MSTSRIYTQGVKQTRDACDNCNCDCWMGSMGFDFYPVENPLDDPNCNEGCCKCCVNSAGTMGCESCCGSGGGSGTNRMSKDQFIRYPWLEFDE